MDLSRPLGGASLVGHKVLPVGCPDLVDEDEHRHGVPAAAAVVGQEAPPEGEDAVGGRDLAYGLEGATVRHLFCDGV